MNNTHVQPRKVHVDIHYGKRKLSGFRPLKVPVIDVDKGVYFTLPVQFVEIQINM